MGATGLTLKENVLFPRGCAYGTNLYPLFHSALAEKTYASMELWVLFRYRNVRLEHCNEIDEDANSLRKLRIFHKASQD